MDIETKSKLLEKTVAFYARTFASSEKAKAYMRSKGMADCAQYGRERLGYADGSLAKSLPSKGRIVDEMKELGILEADGREYFLECVTRPVIGKNGMVEDIAGTDIGTGGEMSLSRKEINAVAPLEDKPELPVEKAGAVNAVTSDNSVKLRFNARSYTLFGMERGNNRLKATVKLERDGRMHVDTVDFYSSPQMKRLKREICIRFGEVAEAVESDMVKIVERLEGEQGKKDGVRNQLIITAEERREAEELGRSGDMFKRIISDFELLGVTGEEDNKLLCYLAMTSRKMVRPLSVFILSSSGAGKSNLMDSTMEFCPEEDLVKITHLSSLALMYREHGLKNKVLAIEEKAGIESAAYALRTLISSNQLTVETTARDASTGRLVSVSNKVEGPVSVFCTSTDPDTDHETLSRFFIIGVDESVEQTKRILEYQKRKYGMEGLRKDLDRERVVAVHRNFQRLLKPYRIVNPLIADTEFADKSLNSRRNQPKYLNLMAGIAFLRQMVKKVKKCEGVEYVEVDRRDFEMCTRLFRSAYGRTGADMGAPTQELLGIMRRLAESKAEKTRRRNPGTEISASSVEFTRREIREFGHWTSARLHMHLKKLMELEYVTMRRNQRCNQHLYQLANGDGDQMDV